MSHPLMLVSCLLGLLGVVSDPSAAGGQNAQRIRKGGHDSADVAQTVARFHESLEKADTATVRILLAADATIMEAGSVETRDHYLAHHMGGDMAFAKAIHAERIPGSVTVAGNVAWTASTSTTRGEFSGREVNSAGAELMVLTRSGNGWRIRAIHWSSARKSPVSAPKP